MPELPEVETMKLQLGKFLTGHKIISVEVKIEKHLCETRKRWLILRYRRFGKMGYTMSI